VVQSPANSVRDLLTQVRKNAVDLPLRKADYTGRPQTWNTLLIAAVSDICTWSTAFHSGASHQDHLNTCCRPVDTTATRQPDQCGNRLKTSCCWSSRCNAWKSQSTFYLGGGPRTASATPREFEFGCFCRTACAGPAAAQCTTQVSEVGCFRAAESFIHSVSRAIMFYSRATITNRWPNIPCLKNPKRAQRQHTPHGTRNGRWEKSVAPKVSEIHTSGTLCSVSSTYTYFCGLASKTAAGTTFNNESICAASSFRLSAFKALARNILPSNFSLLLFSFKNKNQL